VAGKEQLSYQGFLAELLLAEYPVRSGEAIDRGLVDVRVRLVFEVSDDSSRILVQR
jgi:hypothetical protein